MFVCGLTVGVSDSHILMVFYRGCCDFSERWFLCLVFGMTVCIFWWEQWIFVVVVCLGIYFGFWDQLTCDFFLF